MEDFAVMDMFHPQTNLSKPIEDLTLGEISTTLLFNFCSEVAAIGEVHDNAEVTFFGFVALSKSDDIGMIEYLQNLGFFQSFEPLFFRHFWYDNLLNDGQGLVRLALHQERFSKSSFSQ